MFVLPVASVLIEATFFKSSFAFMFLIGKWFVFWAIGARLFLAGLRQAITPQFTAEQILGLKTKEPLIVIQELGFANLSIGLLGLTSILIPAWVFPAALTGGLFYGLAGFRHIASKERNRLETIALVSDLFIFVVMFGYLLWTFANP